MKPPRQTQDDHKRRVTWTRLAEAVFWIIVVLGIVGLSQFDAFLDRMLQ